MRASTVVRAAIANYSGDSLIATTPQLQSGSRMDALDPACGTLKREIDGNSPQPSQAEYSQVTLGLNQLLRRLRGYKTEGEWGSAVVDGASQFADQVALFAAEDGTLALIAQRNLSLPAHFRFSLASAAAFETALASRECVIALRKSSEVTEQLSVADADQRAHIIPVVNGSRAVAALFAADQTGVDVNALELIAGVASIVLERRSNTTLYSQIASAQATKRESMVPAQAPEGENGAAVSGRARNPDLPFWADLKEEQRNLHIRAQRFARVKVAEIQLARPDLCRAGREQRSLYILLRKEIDSAREAFRKQFMSIPSMVDYLHRELVRTMAEGDELKLGADYPGQSV